MRFFNYSKSLSYKFVVKLLSEMASKQKNRFKVVILGDCNVGKTALARNYVKNCFSEHYEATIGANFFLKTLVFEDCVITMQFWDTGGMERFRALNQMYYRGADCCILVFDVTKPNTFHNLDSWHKEFLVLASPDDPKTFPSVVLGNKVDLGKEAVSRKLIEIWCKSKNNIPYFETSAKESINVDLAFRTLAENTLALQDNSFINEEIPETINLMFFDNYQEKKKFNCFCN